MCSSSSLSSHYRQHILACRVSESATTLTASRRTRTCVCRRLRHSVLLFLLNNSRAKVKKKVAILSSSGPPNITMLLLHKWSD